jgi:NAD(P)H-flavin reductase
MGKYHGRVVEVVQGAGRRQAVRLSCPPAAVPAPGQYLLADDGSPYTVVPLPLFLHHRSDDGFLAAPPAPVSWRPGLQLALTGPQGRGFQLPAGARRAALVCLESGFERLMPLARQALHTSAAVALFGDCPLPDLPADLEAYPLSAFPEALQWADFLALDLPVEALPSLASNLGLAVNQVLPFPAQALIDTPMPCAGLADCGICSLPAGRGWKLACSDGPVFNLSEVNW